MGFFYIETRQKVYHCPVLCRFILRLVVIFLTLCARGNIYSLLLLFCMIKRQDATKALFIDIQGDNLKIKQFCYEYWTWKKYITGLKIHVSPVQFRDAPLDKEQGAMLYRHSPFFMVSYQEITICFSIAFGCVLQPFCILLRGHIAGALAYVDIRQHIRIYVE